MGYGEEGVFVRLGRYFHYGSQSVGILRGMPIEQQSVFSNTNNIFPTNGKENDERRNRGKKGRSGN